MSGVPVELWIQVTVAVMAAYAGFASALLSWRLRSRRRVQRREQFFKTLTQALTGDLIQTLDDVGNLYQGVFRSEIDSGVSGYTVAELLRRYLVVIVASDPETVPPDRRQEWKQTITAFISELDSRSPYDNLPNAEKTALTDATLFLEQDNHDEVKRKLGELAVMVQARHDTLTRSSATNRWAVPLTIVGVVLTLFFGIMSWVLAVSRPSVTPEVPSKGAQLRHEPGPVNELRTLSSLALRDSRQLSSALSARCFSAMTPTMERHDAERPLLRSCAGKNRRCESGGGLPTRPFRVS